MGLFEIIFIIRGVVPIVLVIRIYLHGENINLNTLSFDVAHKYNNTKFSANVQHGGQGARI